MLFIISSAALALAISVFAAPAVKATTITPSSFADILTSYLKGFKNPSIQSSVGGKAICVSGTIDVTASAKQILVDSQWQPTNQSSITNLLVEVMQVNSTIGKQLVVGTSDVSGTYGIYSQLCFPSATGINATTIQFLIHGIGSERSYWNVATGGYSFVDYAAEQGYTTFFFDRLGTGLSDHPDAIQTVQLPIQLEIAHQLVQILRNGGISNHAFKHVIGVGHSFGSFQVNGLTTKYPDDLDAAVLTGFSHDTSGFAIAFSGAGLAIASQSQPLHFAALSNGYLTTTGIEGTQFFFFRHPGFDPALLDLGESIKQTLTVGEFLSVATLTGAGISTNFTGPIDVVNGEYDLPNCGGNCLVPSNKAAAVKAALYPAASDEGSSWFIGNGSGHGLNFHFAAPSAYKHIQNFIKKNGF